MANFHDNNDKYLTISNIKVDIDFSIWSSVFAPLAFFIAIMHFDLSKI